MMDKVAVLSLLVASLSFGASATEEDGDAKEVPAVEMENASDSTSKDIVAEEIKEKCERKDELKDEKCKDQDKECDEEKMIKEEKDTESLPGVKDSENDTPSKED